MLKHNYDKKQSSYQNEGRVKPGLYMMIILLKDIDYSLA